MKQIPPAIQKEQRYLKFRVHGEEKELGEVVDDIWSSATKYMGTKEVSKADIRVIGNKFDKEQQEGVMRVHRDKVEDMRAALALNSKLGENGFLAIENVSGTISGLE